MYILKVFNLTCKSSFPGEKKNPPLSHCHTTSYYPIFPGWQETVHYRRLEWGNTSVEHLV